MQTSCQNGAKNNFVKCHFFLDIVGELWDNGYNMGKQSSYPRNTEATNMAKKTTKDATKTEKEKKPTYELKTVNLWPEWGGRYATAKMQVNDPEMNKPEFMLPIPTNDDEAHELYGPHMNMDLITFWGTRAISYAVDKVVKPTFKDVIDREGGWHEKLTDADKTAIIAGFQFQPRETKDSEAKKMARVEKEHGVDTADDLAEKFRRLAIFEAGGNPDEPEVA